MISSFIMLFEVGLIALLLLLVFRMLTLVRNDPFVPASMVTMVTGDHHPTAYPAESPGPGLPGTWAGSGNRAPCGSGIRRRLVVWRCLRPV